MRSVWRLTGTVLASVTLVVGLSAGNSQADPGDFILRNAHSDKCLSVPGASTGWAYLNQFTCGIYADQKWYREYAGHDEAGIAWYKIVNRNSKLCLSVDGGSVWDFARVTQYECGDPLYPDQYWRQLSYDAKTRGYQFKNWNSNKCLAVLDGSKAEAARVIQFSCGSWEDHFWRVE
ncbi:RICIN domain-containing protein [Streptomyces hydrogenans]|uniref:RICIN domain-containing protein n=1 Tax=Streptomyces hydrogenans TaxID=1873719 RepID=UPI00363F53E7